MNRFFRTFIYFSIALCCVIAGFFGYTFYSLPDVKELVRTNPQTTSFIEYRQHEAEENGKEFKVHRSWISFKNIPPLLFRTIVASEDAAFWVHEGVDWYEVRQALKENLEEGKRLRGASTITQQTAKNLYLTPDRNLFRKFKEFIIAKDLEKNLSKERILELYLNYIEFGEGVFGVNSAAHYYFGKNPSGLTIEEMVRLAAIIPNPLQLSPNRPSGGLRWRSYEILNRIYRFEWITEEEYFNAKFKLDSFFGLVNRE